jgi:hypothetical protein
VVSGLTHNFEAVVRDFVAAAATGTEPHATWRSVDLPLGRDHPLFQQGLLGLHALDVPPTSPVRQRRLYQE